MTNNILDYLVSADERFGDRIAFTDGDCGTSFRELHRCAMAAGSGLIGAGPGRPVAILMERSPAMIAALFAVICSGNFYIPLDLEMGSRRIAQIVDKAEPCALICDENTQAEAGHIGFDGPVFHWEALSQGAVCEEALARIRASAIDRDLIYIVFTSGSTGTPKGVAANHRNLIDYTESFCDMLRVGEDTVFGMQSPMYVDSCLQEIMATLRGGARTVLLPRRLFSFPYKLIEFMNENRVNTAVWVSSAFSIVSGMKTLDYIVPELRTVAFGSEVFPPRQLKLWRQALPDARYINLYGPTEGTVMCCWYEVEKGFPDGEAVPIGRPFANTDILLLDEDGRQVTEPGVPGEAVIRGSGVTCGYYNDPGLTREAFVQNPLNKSVPEIVYMTGDLAKYNNNGELVFLTRKDYQIKRMGYRIELMDIEAAAQECDRVNMACCVYAEEKSLIVLYYTGEAREDELASILDSVLPSYMAPGRILKKNGLPMAKNGKVDRALLFRQAAEL